MWLVGSAPIAPKSNAESVLTGPDEVVRVEC